MILTARQVRGARIRHDEYRHGHNDARVYHEAEHGCGPWVVWPRKGQELWILICRGWEDSLRFFFRTGLDIPGL